MNAASKFKLSILTFVLAMSLISGCGQRDKAAQAGPPEMPPSQVSTAAAVLQDVPVYIDEIGKCAAPEIVSIQPQVSGKIVGVHFKEGAEIKKGDKLFTIDVSPFKAQLEQVVADNDLNKAALEQSVAALAQYQAQVEEAKAVLAQSKTRQELNLIEHDRAKNLVKSSAIPQQELDTKMMSVKAGIDQIAADTAGIARAEAQVRQGAATVAMSKAKIGSSEAMISTAKINLGYTTIVSPIDGRAGQRMSDAGNVVNANMMMGGTSALVVIQRMDPLFVDMTIPESELARAQASMAAGSLKAICRAPNPGAKAREGAVVFIDSSVQDGTGTVKLRASIPNEDRAFWPGQFVKVRLILSTRKDTALIPLTAPQVGQTGPYVYVVKSDSTVEMRPVKLGQKHDNLIAIEEGVAAGDAVVLAGQLMLFPGAKVAAQPVDSAAPKTLEKKDDKAPSKPAEEIADQKGGNK